MQGEPTLGGSLTSAIQFLGDTIFSWIPNVITAVIDSASETIATTTPILGPLEDPLRAEDVPGFVERVAAPGVYDSFVQGWYVFVLLSLTISIPFLAVAIYCLMRVYLLRRHEAHLFKASAQTVAAKDIPK